MGIVYINEDKYNIIGAFKGAKPINYLYSGDSMFYNGAKAARIGVSVILDPLPIEVTNLMANSKKIKIIDSLDKLDSDYSYAEPITLNEEYEVQFYGQSLSEEDINNNLRGYSYFYSPKSDRLYYNENITESQYPLLYIQKNIRKNLPKWHYVKHLYGSYFDYDNVKNLNINLASVESIEGLSSRRFLESIYLNTARNVKNLQGCFYGDVNLTFLGGKKHEITLNNVTNLTSAFTGCGLLVQTVNSSNIDNLYCAYQFCSSLRKASCGRNVINMYSAYQHCTSLINAACGPKVENMARAYEYCNNLKKAVCGSNVISMDSTYQYCTNLTEAACGPKVVDMYCAYQYCTNLKKAVCSDSVIYLTSAYQYCTNLTDAIIGNNVEYLSSAYQGCYNLRNVYVGTRYNNYNGGDAYQAFSSNHALVENFEYHDSSKSLFMRNYAWCFPCLKNIIIGDEVYAIPFFFNGSRFLEKAACGNNVVYINTTYGYCYNLLYASCGPNVKNMERAYEYCISLVTPVSGINVANMESSYQRCFNLVQGSCGSNVIYLTTAYIGDKNIIVARCGDNVKKASSAYCDCTNLKYGEIGNNATYIYSMYFNTNVRGTFYINSFNEYNNLVPSNYYSNYNFYSIYNMSGLFQWRRNRELLNIYFPSNNTIMFNLFKKSFTAVLDHDSSDSYNIEDYYDEQNKCYFFPRSNTKVYWDTNQYNLGKLAINKNITTDIYYSVIKNIPLPEYGLIAENPGHLVKENQKEVKWSCEGKAHIENNNIVFNNDFTKNDIVKITLSSKYKSNLKDSIELKGIRGSVDYMLYYNGAESTENIDKDTGIPYTLYNYKNLTIGSANTEHSFIKVTFKGIKKIKAFMKMAVASPALGSITAKCRIDNTLVENWGSLGVFNTHEYTVLDDKEHTLTINIGTALSTTKANIECYFIIEE